ncbi:MAG TPA: BON domain-containing protein [Steroidobacteraceae bacterium]|jgi:osmotically-inducible protein OsmY
MPPIKPTVAVLWILLACVSACAAKPPPAQPVRAATGYVDGDITAKVKTAIRNARGIDVSGITVATSQGTVLLSGFVPARSDALGALRVASRVDGVRAVNDQTQVRVVVGP